MDRHIDEILNISKGPIETVEQAKAMVDAVEQNLATTFKIEDNLDPRFEEDFEVVRDTVKEMIVEIKKTVYRISLIAADTEKALDFSAMAQMSTVLLNCNKQILEIYEFKKKYLTKKEPKVPQPQLTQNVQNVTADVVFTGTTNDLKNYIKKMKEDKEKEDETKTVNVTPTSGPSES